MGDDGSRAKAENPVRPMRVGGKYEIESELGRGAFGTVYAARDVILDRIVALKVLRREALGSSASSRESFQRRFLREARAAARLSHPNVVAIYDAGGDGETSYLAMEHVPGRTLRRLMESDSDMPVAKAVGLLRQLCAGLHDAHTVGIVHRDVKPENVMVRDDGVVKLTDLGVAKVLLGETSSLSREGGTFGTPSYMAPEQVLSRPIDGRTDQYAACAVMYEMVAGVRPFVADTMPALIYLILSERPLAPSDHRPVPAAVEEVIMKGLAKNPADRFASCRQLADALAATGLEGKPGTAPHRAHVATASVAPAPQSTLPTLTYRWTPPVGAREPDEGGSLDTRPAAELLLSLRSRGYSGLLVIDGETTIGIDLSRGAPIGACGGPSATALGALLRRQRIVDDPKYAELHAERKRIVLDGGEPPRLGELAVRMGMCGPGDLLGVLETQIDLRLQACFAMDGGSWALYRELTSREWTEMTERPIEELTARWFAEHADAASAAGRSFRSRHGSERLVARLDAADLLPLFRFGPAVQRILRRLDGSRTLDETLIAHAAGSDVELAVYLLWARGAFRVRADLPAPRVAQLPGWSSDRSGGRRSAIDEE